LTRFRAARNLNTRRARQVHDWRKQCGGQ
jgi:hypothetical protein